MQNEGKNITKIKFDKSTIINYSVLLLMMMIIYFVLFGSKTVNLTFEKIPSICINYLFVCFFTGFFEEALFRGLLMETLSYYKCDQYRNIIQAIIFGIAHMYMYSSFGLWGIVGISHQILWGYIFWQIYKKSNSLLPGTLLHGFIDILPI